MVQRQGHSGMTLVEVMVAMTVGSVMLAVTWSLFVRVKESIARTSTRVEIHNAADHLRAALERDLANQAPVLACFVRSNPASTATTRSENVELLFMRTISPLRTQSSQGAYDQYLGEWHWVRWRFARTMTLVNGRWTISSCGLWRSSSTPTRQWRTTAALTAGVPIVDPGTGLAWATYNQANWINIPRPLRDASAGIASLDANRYGVPASAIDALTPVGDVGDLEDLDGNERLASSFVRDFRISWVDAAGHVHSVDNGTAVEVGVSGLHMDVLGPAGNDYAGQIAARPRLFRISTALADPASPRRVLEFSCSIAAPGLHPPILQPSP